MSTPHTGESSRSAASGSSPSSSNARCCGNQNVTCPCACGAPHVTGGASLGVSVRTSNRAVKSYGSDGSLLRCADVACTTVVTDAVDDNWFSVIASDSAASTPRTGIARVTGNSPVHGSSSVRIVPDASEATDSWVPMPRRSTRTSRSPPSYCPYRAAATGLSSRIRTSTVRSLPFTRTVIRCPRLPRRYGRFSTSSAPLATVRNCSRTGWSAAAPASPSAPRICSCSPSTTAGGNGSRYTRPTLPSSWAPYASTYVEDGAATGACEVGQMGGSVAGWGALSGLRAGVSVFCPVWSWRGVLVAWVTFSMVSR